MHRIQNFVCFTASALALLMLVSAGADHGAAAASTDDQIKQAIIQQSIASYPGHCPCPYNFASNGSHCGKRSAWSKAGGYAPICYPDEVTPEMIQRWKLSAQAKN
jgi:hypothetical protein